MTLGRSRALRRYWSSHPRVDWLKAAQLGYKPPAVLVPKTRVPRGPLPAASSSGARPGTDLLERFGVLAPGMMYRE